MLVKSCAETRCNYHAKIFPSALYPSLPRLYGRVFDGTDKWIEAARCRPTRNYQKLRISKIQIEDSLNHLYYNSPEVSLSAFANCGSQLLLVRLGRCL